MSDDKNVIGVQKRIRKLEPGMVLARKVYDRSGCPLMDKDRNLSQKDIDRLEQRDKRFVYVYTPGNEPETELKNAS